MVTILHYYVLKQPQRHLHNVDSSSLMFDRKTGIVAVIPRVKRNRGHYYFLHYQIHQEDPCMQARNYLVSSAIAAWYHTPPQIERSLPLFIARPSDNRNSASLYWTMLMATEWIRMIRERAYWKKQQAMFPRFHEIAKNLTLVKPMQEWSRNSSGYSHHQELHFHCHSESLTTESCFKGNRTLDACE